MPANYDVVIITVTAQKEGQSGHGAAILPVNALATTFIGLSGPSSKQSLCTAELTAVARALEILASAVTKVPAFRSKVISLTLQNRGVLQAITQPKLTDLDCPFWLAPMPLYVNKIRLDFIVRCLHNLVSLPWRARL
jgi:hypothetical protein